MEWLIDLNKRVNDLAWGPPMLVALIGVGLDLTVRTRFIQFGKFALMCRETIGKMFRRGPTAEGDVTPFQAVTVAMGGTVGVGLVHPGGSGRFDNQYSIDLSALRKCQ